MKRYGSRLLAAYAMAMTLFAAWLGCRCYVYWRLLGGVYTKIGADHAQIMATWNAPGHLTTTIDQPAMLFASLEPTNLAAAVFVIFLAFLAFAPKKRTPPTSVPEKD